MINYDNNTNGFGKISFGRDSVAGNLHGIILIELPSRDSDNINRGITKLGDRLIFYDDGFIIKTNDNIPPIQEYKECFIAMSKKLMEWARIIEKTQDN